MKQIIKYKRIFLDIPVESFLCMDIYCSSDFNLEIKDISYSNFLRNAIEYYIDNHSNNLSQVKLNRLSKIKRIN